MPRKTKDEIKYFLVNTILLLISLALIMCIVFILKDNKQNIIAEQNNTNTNIFSNDEESIVIPITNNVAENKEPIALPPVIAETNNEEYDFDIIVNNKYYYNQLNNNAKLIYDSIEKNLNNMKTGNHKIKLPSTVSNVFNYSNGNELLDNDFQSAWDAIALDRMDVFFIDISKVRLSIKKTTRGNDVSYELTIVPQDDRGYLTDGLEDKNSVDAMLVNVKNVRDNIITNVTGNNYNKILQVHDWIIENFEYSSNFDNANVYNLYGALIEKSAVCEGYAESFKYVLDELRIPCIIVSGTATNSEGLTENHAWNYVQLNGSWYAVDTTWDDPVVRGVGFVTNATKHKYFMQGSDYMNKNHFPDGKLTENGQEFIYPRLEINEYEK